MRAMLLAMCAITGPAFAVPPIAYAQNADFAADARVVENARSFAQMTAGQARGSDKTLYLGRDERGEIVLTGIAMGAPAGAAGDKAAAALWIRRGVKTPGEADRAAAERLGIPLFVYDEASGAMWEIGRQEGVMQYRKATKRPGEWQRWK